MLVTDFCNCRNSRRVAEVWLDEFIHFFYETRPSALQIPYGDIGDRKELRSRLKCRGFGWYQKTIYPELATPSRHELAYGQLRQRNLCLQGPDSPPPDQVSGWRKHPFLRSQVAKVSDKIISILTVQRSPKR
nr:polypeptide N-acetylgalactosaminyltransferase 2-like [Cherax quadricarinatus]